MLCCRPPGCGCHSHTVLLLRAIAMCVLVCFCCVPTSSSILARHACMCDVVLLIHTDMGIVHVAGCLVCSCTCRMPFAAARYACEGAKLINCGSKWFRQKEGKSSESGDCIACTTLVQAYLGARLNCFAMRSAPFRRIGLC